ncbi:hypothetical protein FOPG_19128 [Fusarium oxysporum f. sp. conglutinans race 2 54008]|uniref:Uncharacterized protein n=1 Tax=Fusarium oxysporum f. sp. conglutinans race 2 54008 TaxID=1089457 RepID=X0GXP5_FUSOX|nr:hypothetical protein FOPG_19128 [Fusarium oxysporum f. sp. conglutinans race 2 54008]
MRQRSTNLHNPFSIYLTRFWSYMRGERYSSALLRQPQITSNGWVGNATQGKHQETT